MKLNELLYRKWINHSNLLYIILVLMITVLVFACGKNGSLPSSPGHTALLVKEVDIARTAQNVVFDSTLTTYQYNNNKQVTQVQQTINSLINGSSATSSTTWAFNYSGNLLSQSAENFSSQTTVSGIPASSSSGYIVNTFYARGNNISYYKGITTAKSIAGGITVNSIVYDSAVFGYSGNNVSSYIQYHKVQTASVYKQLYKNTYNYNGNNLTGFIDIVTASGVDTITGTYSYDNKTNFLPVNYIVPGVYFYTPNNITKLTQVTTGTAPSTRTYTYQWTYNSNNQPSACKATITTNPAGGIDDGAVVSSSYYYQ